MRDRDWIGVAAVAWVIGLGALLCDHFRLPPSLILNAHLLFATVTCCAICAVLIEKARSLAGAPRDELYLSARLISRWVYILMYVLALARVCLYLEETYQHCASCGVGHDSAPVHSLDDFQFYIACCVIPLWLARSVVLAVPLKSRRVRSRGTSHADTAATSEKVSATTRSASSPAG
jgi:hypothetical protein